MFISLQTEAKQIAGMANAYHQRANPSPLDADDIKRLLAERDDRISLLVNSGFSVAILYSSSLEACGRLILIDSDLAGSLACS